MQVATAIGAAELPLKRSNQLLNQLWVTMKNTMRWRLTTGALNSFIGGLQQAFGYSKSLNASLNDIRIVTGKSADEMSRFAKEANQAAKELSTTTTTYTDASLIYYQQGLDSEAVKERTDATIKMANVTGQSAETISSQMTAVWNNFREGSRTLESYADTMVALGATTASSSKEIAEGLEKFAPIANSVGLSFDYASAALATLVATTRESASVAGNALKTLFSRLEGLKLGETLEDGTDLNKYSQALYTVGINIKDTNGELKDMDLILSELGNRWKDLARDEQMALAQTVGGVRQYAQLVALMDNWQTFQQNLVTARTAEGSLEKQAQIYAESWEASRDRVKAAAEDVYDSLINPKVFIDLDKMSQAVLKPLASILDGIGGLTGLLPIAAALMTKVYSAQIANVMRDMAVNIGLMTGYEQQRAREIQVQSDAYARQLGIMDQDQSSVSRRVEIMSHWNDLQREINIHADSYSESQMDQIKNAQYFISLLKDQALASADAVDKAQEAYETAIENITLKLDLPDVTGFAEKVTDAYAYTTSKASDSLTKLLSSINYNDDIDVIFKTLNDGLEVVVNKQAKIDALKASLKETGEQTDEWKIKVKNLAVELGLMEKTATLDEAALEKIKIGLSDSSALIQETSQDLSILRSLLISLAGGDKEAEKLVDALILRFSKLQVATENADISLEHLEKTVNNAKNNPPPDYSDWADMLVAIANGASRAAMAIQSFENIIEVFSDDSLDNAEKFTRILTSLSMLLPTLTAVIGIFGKGALKAGADVATAGVTAGTGIAAGATAAKAAMPIVTAIIFGIYLVIKAIDALVITQKEARESIQKTIDAYKEAESELQSLQSELSTTQDRIKELQELAESGSISIVEQEELRDLQIENDRLERQLELKERLAKLKFKETVSEVRKNGYKAYKLTEEGSPEINDLVNAYWDAFRNVEASREETIFLGDIASKIGTHGSAFTRQMAIDWIDTGLDQQTKDKYINDINILYDAIDDVIQEYHDKWLAENAETLDLIEDLYQQYVENIDEVQASDFQKVLTQLRELRHALYDDNGDYERYFVDSVLNQLDSQDIGHLIARQANLISEAGQQILINSGADPDELVSRYTEIYNKAKTELDKFGLGDTVKSFGYVELKLIADNDFKDFQQLLNYLKTNSGVISVSLQVQAIEDARTEALAKLASGEMLDEELITKLQEAYSGIKDISDFANRSVKDQIEFLSKEGKVVNSQIKELEERQDKLKERQKELTNEKIKSVAASPSFDTTLSNSLIKATEDAIDEIDADLEKLRNNFEKEPWQLNIELGNEVAAELNNAKKAIALINDDLTVSAENLVELGKRYPEALEKAWYDESQNVLKINQETYDQLRILIDETLDHDRQANRDAAADKLLAQAQLTDGIIKLVSLAEGETRDEQRDTLIQTLQNNDDQLASAKSMALQSMLTVVRNEAIKRQNYLDTLVQQQAGDKTTTDTMKENARINVENQAEAATEILRIFDDLFQKISNGSKDAFEGNYTSLFSHYTSGYSGQQGVTYQQQYTKNVQDIRDSADYKLNELALNYTNDLADAIQGFLNEEKSWEEVQKAFYDSPAIFAGAGQRLFGESFAKIIETGLENTDAEAFVRQIEDYYGNNDDALAALQDIRNQTIEALSNLLESPETDKTKGGSGGKSDLVKLDKADLDAEEQALEEIEDRYHEITREIERQERVLTKLEHQIDRTYGLDRLKLYEQEIKDLNKLQDDQRTKSARAERYLKDVDTDRLINAFQATGYKENLANRLSARGIGFAGSGSYDIASSIDSIGKEITNFEEVERYINQDMNNFMSAYTDFMKQYDEFVQKYEAMTDEEKLLVQAEAEQWKLDYELLQDQFKLVEAQQEERLAAIEQYESTLDTINTLAHEIEDTQRRIEDTKLNEITYRMDVILDVRDARKQIRDFTKEIAESFGDALTHGVRTAELGWDQAKDEMAMYKEYVQEYNDLKSLLDNATEYTDTEAIVAELRELEGNIIESGQRLLEWSEQVENMFVEALSAAADRFSYFTNQLEHNDTILSTMKELYALQGQTYKTQQGFNRLQKVAQERLETQVSQARLQRKWFEEADSRLQEAQAQLDTLIAEKGAEAEQDFRYDTFKKNRDALLKEQQEAQKAMLSAAQQAMETAQQMYLDQIEKAVYEFGQALSGGIGLDLLQDKYDHYIEEEERYLDKVNEAYQVAAWYDKLQKDIDNTTNKLTKDRLKALQQEIDIRREGNTLSQYDLDILEAKYKVLQAQADLEDAQNAKSQLRLVRDSQGNWNYQFTTNPDDIAAKEQELLQAENEWYNIAKEQTKEVTGEIIATWQECQEAINEIYSDTSNFVMNEETGRLELTKEAQERETEIRKFYADKVKFLEEEKQIAIGDMTEAGNQAMIHMAIAAGETVEDITGITGREVESLVETTGMNSQQLLQLSLSQIEDILENRLAQLAEDIGISADDLKDMLQRKENGIESDADSTFKAILESADPATVDLYNLFAENWDLIGSLVGETSSGIKGNIADTYTKIQSGLNDTGTAMNLFDNIFAKDLTSMTKNTAIFEVEFDRAVENMQNSFDNYGETIADVADDCGVSLEALDDSVNMVSDSTDRMIWEGLDAAQAIWDQVDATWDAQQGYLDLASAVWEYIYALQALAAEQVVPTIEEASGVDTFKDENRFKEYDSSTDWSMEMGKSARAGDWAAVDVYSGYRDRKQEERGYYDSVATEDIKNALVEAYKEGNEDLKEELEEVLNSPNKYYRDVISVTPEGLATGGYTGEFDNGRLAFLHEKELVLNAEDTKNILDAVQMVRTMQDNLFGNIAEQLDSDGFAAMALLGQRMGGIGLPAASTDFEQHVTIESVSFPGVTSSREIEEAFESLVNDAAQWARRRKS